MTNVCLEEAIYWGSYKPEGVTVGGSFSSEVVSESPEASRDRHLDRKRPLATLKTTSREKLPPTVKIRYEAAVLHATSTSIAVYNMTSTDNVDL